MGREENTNGYQRADEEGDLLFDKFSELVRCYSVLLEEERQCHKRPLDKLTEQERHHVRSIHEYTKHELHRKRTELVSAYCDLMIHDKKRGAWRNYYAYLTGLGAPEHIPRIDHLDALVMQGYVLDEAIKRLAGKGAEFAVQIERKNTKKSIDDTVL